ncbi:MAG: ArsR/SmtB family transcription factor [Candidatus Hodarchaeales archaeon]|jgi:predicted transcriptional regulator
MSKETYNELLRLVSDPTRFQILIILLNAPAQNPADLAKKLSLTRPGIEKHLKMLRTFWLIEREVESWPSPRFVYGLTQVGRDFLNRLTDLFDSYTHETCGSIVSEIETIEKKFILGKIKRPQYEEELKELKKAQKIFENT